MVRTAHVWPQFSHRYVVPIGSTAMTSTRVQVFSQTGQTIVPKDSRGSADSWRAFASSGVGLKSLGSTPHVNAIELPGDCAGLKTVGSWARIAAEGAARGVLGNSSLGTARGVVTNPQGQCSKGNASIRATVSVGHKNP